jgi:hypothetical protein
MKRTAKPRGADGQVGVGERHDVDPERTSDLNRLQALGEQELRAEWRRLYRTQPPRLSRDLLMRGVAYRIQELAHGGLSKAARRRLAAFDQAMEDKGSFAGVPEKVPLRSGTRLLREWHGRTHTVIVIETGFEYAGTVYPSLTQIAEKITGAHWSGPRFFGLGRRLAPSRADLPSPPRPDDAGANENTLPPERAKDQDVVHG